MAKSSRSKWKKAHRRQRAQLEAATVAKRIGRLNKKLKLAATGGLSNVPLQDPEKRFHFVNPQMDRNVPHNCKGLNNNYEQVVSESLDFSKPLKLKPPTTNYYGKSNPDEPHPTKFKFETVSAAAPVAGHALSVKDVERMEARETELTKLENIAGNCIAAQAENEEDTEMEEFVLGCNDAVGETTANLKTLLAGRGLGGTPLQKSKKAAGLAVRPKTRSKTNTAASKSGKRK
uniref:Uncharacterized protein n=1 Tax=Trypanosoma congolense (strain IL3000) TaxID=1068625 RepID=G0UTZ7_TRYCI|nr:conserved hypothetical protein [Trypanosoma congolense IL3000]